MLEPGVRRLFLETLRPPEGYEFDRAVGTTFTLDLMALLAVPLAFTFSQSEDGEGRLASDPIALLESARRHASRIAVFCHGGYAAVPRPGQAVLAFLENSVVSAFPHDAHNAGAIFHPKVWVLRFLADRGSVIYRVVCQSRNLTFDHSWDTSLVLNGQLRQDRVNAFAVNHPLADFVSSLPEMASAPVPAFHRQSVDLFASELRKVAFQAPDGLRLSRFLGFGTGRRNTTFPGLEHRPLLVISPFLDDGFLGQLAARRPRTVLISRRESLLKSSRDVIAKFDEVFAFRSGLEPEPEDLDTMLPPLTGLHAKVFVIDDGWDARVVIGSANSTRAGLGNPPRNVEFMVELVGRKSRFGIEALLSCDENERSLGKFSSLITPFEFPVEPDPPDGDDDLNRPLDATAEAIARSALRAKVDPTGDETFLMRLLVITPIEKAAEVVSVKCWPVTLRPAQAQDFADGAEFGGLRIEDLSAFLAIEISASADGITVRRRFARSITVEGMPDDRLARLISKMLSDRRRLFQLLWLLLSPDADMTYGQFERLSDDGHLSGSGWGAGNSGMLERMLETLAAEPKRLDSVDELLRDLRATDLGAETIGDEFFQAWDTLMSVRKKRA